MPADLPDQIRQLADWFHGAMTRLEALHPPLKEQLEAVEAQLVRLASAHFPLLRTAAKHVTCGGGKRVRPAILLLSAAACGRITHRAIVYAAVVELLHVASLVHDDVIDEAARRRGKPSARSRWGNKISVMVGDYLLARSFLRAATDGEQSLIEELAAAATQMCIGQIVELTAQGPDFSQADYMKMSRAKTASLMGAAARIGARVGNGDARAIEMLGRFGMHFGTAFQLADDLLDLIAAEEQVGKPVLEDLRQGKVTLPLIYVLRTAPPAARARLRQEITNGQPRIGTVLRITAEYGGIKYARAAVRRYLANARKMLLLLPESTARQALLSACADAFPLPVV